MLLLQIAAIVMPVFIVIGIGLISMNTRLARIETKLTPIYDWWLEERIQRHD